MLILQLYNIHSLRYNKVLSWFFFCAEDWGWGWWHHCRRTIQYCNIRTRFFPSFMFMRIKVKHENEKIKSFTKLWKQQGRISLQQIVHTCHIDLKNIYWKRGMVNKQYSWFIYFQNYLYSLLDTVSLWKHWFFVCQGGFYLFWYVARKKKNHLHRTATQLMSSIFPPTPWLYCA